MEPHYQFDDDDKTLPVWKVRYQDVRLREGRRPFFKQQVLVRAKDRQTAIEKVQALHSGVWDTWTASKIKERPNQDRI